MSDFAALDRAALSVEGPSAGSREARGSLALKALAALNVIGVLIAFFPGTTPVATLLVVLFNLGAAALAVVYLVVAFNLDRNRPWAAAALRPLLVLIVVAGAYSLYTGFTGGKFRMPFDVVLAGWALFGRSDVKPAPNQTPRSVALVAGAVPLLALMLFALPLGGWGGQLDVHEPDLDAALAVQCGTGSGVTSASGVPAEIGLHYNWSWRSTGVLPSGTDIVVIGWTGADADGHPLYTIGDIPGDGTGIFPGLAGYPSTDMANDIAHETNGSFRWAIVVDQQQLQPAEIDLKLRRARESPPGPQPLVITATYIHAGLWRHGAPSVTCSW
jgi:hypothetical protein